MRQTIELTAVLLQQRGDLPVGVLDEPPYLLVDEALGLRRRAAHTRKQRRTTVG